MDRTPTPLNKSPDREYFAHANLDWNITYSKSNSVHDKVLFKIDFDVYWIMPSYTINNAILYNEPHNWMFFVWIEFQIDILWFKNVWLGWDKPNMKAYSIANKQT